MTAADEVLLAQSQERLRQERETFDQQKLQDSRWFWVKLAMGWVSVVLLPGILVVAALILWHHSEFSAATVSLSASALLVDAVGIAGSVYKLTLANQPKKPLAPVTQRAKPN